MPAQYTAAYSGPPALGSYAGAHTSFDGCSTSFGAYSNMQPSIAGYSTPASFGPYFNMQSSLAGCSMPALFGDYSKRQPLDSGTSTAASFGAYSTTQPRFTGYSTAAMFGEYSNVQPKAAADAFQQIQVQPAVGGVGTTEAHGGCSLVHSQAHRAVLRLRRYSYLAVGLWTRY